MEGSAQKNWDQFKLEDRPWQSSYNPSTKKNIDFPSFPHLPALLAEASKKFDKTHAFIACMPNGMNGKLTYRQVEDLSNAFAIYLREELKLQPGDRVAIQLPNCLSYPIAAMGIFKAGLILVNTNPLYTASEMKHQFKDAEVKCVLIMNMFGDKLEKIVGDFPGLNIVVCRIADFFPPLVGSVIEFIQKYWNQVIPKYELSHSLFVPALRRVMKKYKRPMDREEKVKEYLSAIHPESVAVLQYTGGTTGVSKGAVLTHLNIMSNIAQVNEFLQSKVDRGQECVLTALPLYHIFAFTVNFLTFYDFGGKNILIPSPRPLSNLKRSLENYPVTWITAVNTLLNGLLNEIWFTDSPPKKLKAAAAGGMALQKAVAERWEALTNCPVVEGYGLSESSPVITFNPLNENVVRESIGIPVPSTDVKCVDEEGREVPIGEAGEIWAKGPQIMKGYWNRPDETEKTLTSDGWLKTGDIGVMDKNGFFKIVDRKKDMVLVSGFNVYPNEVEDCLAVHEKVLESAVIGIPDEKTNEAVKAYIVLKEGQEASREELIKHCRDRLTAYKVPKHIEFRTEIPKSPVGKILRKELRKELEANHG